MRLLMILAACALIGLATGCSDDKKEEAQRLEQEMLGGEQRSDTGVSDDGVPATRPSDTAPSATSRPEAIPQEESMPVGLPSQPAGSGYAVQVASCPSSDYAESLVERYMKRGYQPWVVTYTAPDGGIFFRVRLGWYGSLSEAQQVKRELADRYSVDAWIDHRL